MRIINNPYIIAIDFDGCLCLDGWPDITKGKLIESTVVKMYEQLAKNPNTEFVLWTARAGKSFIDAVNFCKEYNLPIYYFNEQHPSTSAFLHEYGSEMPPGKLMKIFAHEYWDDLAVRIIS